MMNNHTAVHMNVMMSIHIINSYGSKIIIFHIIQPLMLTHQFSMYQHIIFHTIHAIQFKKIQMDIFGPTSKSRLFLTVPHQSVGCPWTAPPHHASVPFLRTEIRTWPFPVSQHPKPLSWLLNNKKPSRTKPLPPGVFETP